MSVVSPQDIMSGSHFDVIVIGGGISGLTAAYTVKRKTPHAKVIVLEGKGMCYVTYFFANFNFTSIFCYIWFHVEI